MNSNGSDQVQLTSGLAKNFPSASPDGKWVFYNTTDDWHLWKTSIDGGEPVQVTSYPAHFPSLSPDGKMIACITRDEPNELLILSAEDGRLVKGFVFAGVHHRLQWTPDGKALICAVERDGAMTLIKYPLAGGSPQQILNLGVDEGFDVGYFFDGRSLALIRGEWKHDAVLISNIK